MLKDTKIKTKKRVADKSVSTPKKRPVVLWALFIALAFVVSGFVINELIYSNGNDATGNASETDTEEDFIIPEDVIYNYECLGTDELTEVSDLESQLLGMTSEMTGVTVTVEEELESGREMHKYSKRDKKFITGEMLDRVQEILDKLITEIHNPRGFTYKIYVIKDEQINAFTWGGMIYVTTAMLEFVENDDELACVIGHEIAHNEQGHIAYMLKKYKISTGIFGSQLGSELVNINSMFTQSFNQKKETESDFYGIGYAYRAGYDACKSITVWKRMSESEDDFDQLTNIGRSHPYSSKRADCCRNHIEENYKAKCD
jgi:predicted Zn-dependent protease